MDWMVAPNFAGLRCRVGDQRQVAKLCLGLAKAKEGSAAHVDKNPRLSADPEEVTGRRAIGLIRAPPEPRIWTATGLAAQL